MARLPAALADMPQPQLIRLVKLLQRHNIVGSLGAWQQYIKACGPASKGNDPARHTPQTLHAFVESLLQPPAAKGAASSTTSQPSCSNARIVRRMVEYLVRVSKEQLMGATSMPPPKSAAAGIGQLDLWDLVHATHSHPKYAAQYNQFPCYLPSWGRTKRRVIQHQDDDNRAASSAAAASGEGPSSSEGDVGALLPRGVRVLALDCEMAKTDTQGGRTLVGLSVVDASGKVVLDSLVKPREPVVDYVTHITGISEKDLRSVTVRRSDVRAMLRAMIKSAWTNHREVTVLVGHSLYNDLEALHLDHAPVIDTALLFSYQGMPDCTPSLQDVHQAVLGQDMAVRAASGRHNSAEDARATLALVMHELRAGARSAPLPPPARQASRDDLRELLVHSIPPEVSESALLQLFRPMLAAGSLEVPAAASLGSSASDMAAAPGGGASGQNALAAGRKGIVVGGVPGASTTPVSVKATDQEDEDSDEEPDSEDEREEGLGGLQQLPQGVQDADVVGGNGTTTQQAQVKRKVAAVKERCGAKGGITLMPEFATQPSIVAQRARLVFKHAGEANAAFAALQGKLSTDIQGRPQKTVALGPGVHVRVRKAAGHNGRLFTTARNRVHRSPVAAKQPASGRKRAASSTPGAKPARPAKAAGAGGTKRKRASA